MEDRLAELDRRLAQAKEGGGEHRIQQQHQRGKLTARERLDLLVDKGSFEELDALVVHRCSDFGLDAQRYPGDGVVTGIGMINGRPAYIFAQDFTVLGGSLSETHAQKICKVMDLAVKNGAPVIGLLDSGGARIQEGPASLAGYGEIFLRNTLASGVVPQISAVMGPCAGGAVYSPAITDFVLMVKNTSYMFITGPDVVRSVTREEVSFEQLGGAEVQASRSGVAHFLTKDEPQCIAQIKRLLSYLPQNNLEDPPPAECTDDPNRMDEALLHVIPDDPAKPYDMRQVIHRIIDHGDFFEVHQHFAQNILVGFARLAGHVVGLVAQQPSHLAGVLDIDSSVKAARFIRFCDAFNFPLVTLVDTSGFMPGLAQEHGGIIRHGAKLLYAYSEATVPKLTVITRKAYGGAYIAMSSKHLRSDLNLAWPTGDIAVMGAQGAVNIIYRDALATAQDPQAERERLEREYWGKFSNPYVAAERGYLDAVIDPRQTRPRLIRALEMFRHKRDTMPPKKHGNIPL